MNEQPTPRTRAAAPIHVEPIYVDLQTAAAMLSLSTATVQRMVVTGELSPPRELSPGRVGYLVDELRAWAYNRPVSTKLPPANTSGRRKAA
jgi:prophage regulatory protein